MANQKKYTNAFLTLSREALDNLPFGAYVINRDGKILFFNQEMARISGVSDSRQIEGQNVYEIPTYKKYGLLNFVEKGLRGEPFSIKCIQYISHIGKKESFRDYYGIPIKDEKGKVEKLLCIVEDTTKRRQLETQVVDDLDEKRELLRDIRDRVNENIEVISEALNSTKSFIKKKYK